MFYLLIGLGASVGAISRYLVSSILLKTVIFGFPIGTVIVNLLGCFLIGIFLVSTLYLSTFFIKLNKKSR